MVDRLKFGQAILVLRLCQLNPSGVSNSSAILELVVLWWCDQIGLLISFFLVICIMSFSYTFFFFLGEAFFNILIVTYSSLSHSTWTHPKCVYSRNSTFFLPWKLLLLVLKRQNIYFQAASWSCIRVTIQVSMSCSCCVKIGVFS